MKEIVKEALNYTLMFQSKVAGVSYTPQTLALIDYHLRNINRQHIIENKSEIMSLIKLPFKYRFLQALQEEPPKRVKRNTVIKIEK